MTGRDDIREFLVSRRAKVTPQMAGLPAGGSPRRVPGLRRGEVAVLAGVSVEYYTRMERGDLRGVSDGVLDAVAQALHMDVAETAHLYDLARIANAGARPRRRASHQVAVRQSLRHLIDSMTDAPAVIGNNRGDIVAINEIGRALYSPLFTGVRPVNYSRFIFLEPAARTFYLRWEEIADWNVAALRTAAGQDPFDRALTDLVGELSTRSDEFRRRWAAHDVRLHVKGEKTVIHPVVGDVTLAYDSLALPADPGLKLTVYTAAPESHAADSLRLLQSWWASERESSHADMQN